MPEYPDITVYLEALERRILGRSLNTATVNSPFLLRTAVPPLAEFFDREVTALERIGKRIAIGFRGELWMVFHLMIAGRLHWKVAGAKPPGKSALISLVFDNGLLYLTEAGTKKRASLHLVSGEENLRALDPGGINVLATTVSEFSERLCAANHTLKRALTDPRIFSGIGNAYSDEILHRAGLSPIAMTQKLSDEEIGRLHAAVTAMLELWTDRLRAHYGDDFPEKVTAFRDDMAAHGRYGQPCPVCGTPIQRIRYATNEINYCPTCQTGGRVLADRGLSRLLKKDWPRSVDELEKLKPR
ncbi:formamidopyrimidine-DNA glycosylase [Exilibacterium tricleocarpae]|uniref:Formamidopyrimidine-DNA glycosylase n=1 Tax=Exilibacterium tricleocarpae TaxID=2591008 RepID=A0A545SY45_9GAMM|nr:DNA-formamidopyrimidine glycosylase family protein [Exilibacterium tricleocarpae]TQV69881.1 formamidopyrimidine-DNA glycosylase [Exilibacterium tricleocarpae]